MGKVCHLLEVVFVQGNLASKGVTKESSDCLEVVHNALPVPLGGVGPVFAPGIEGYLLEGGTHAKGLEEFVLCEVGSE